MLEALKYISPLANITIEVSISSCTLVSSSDLIRHVHRLQCNAHVGLVLCLGPRLLVHQHGASCLFSFMLSDVVMST